jgi:6-phosphofructokinase 1
MKLANLGGIKLNNKIRKIGIITGGGDCSGLNAVINGITKTAVNKYGIEVVGFTRGYSGLYKNDYRPLGLRSVSGIMHEGGTILKSWCGCINCYRWRWNFN